MILKNLYNVLEQGVLKKIMLNKLDLKVKKKQEREKFGCRYTCQNITP